MLWDDPWIVAAATRRRDDDSPFCTTLPPPPPVLPVGIAFDCMRPSAMPLDQWRSVVGTRWTDGELRSRLEGAWIACLVGAKEGLLATCVLRPLNGEWLLETLVAKTQGRGHGNLLVRCAMTWIWNRVSGPFVLCYTWELRGLCSLLVAWWRGWLRSAAAIEYGWLWRSNEPTVPVTRQAMPMWIDAGDGEALVSDSGLDDGQGYVLRTHNSVDWNLACQKGGWRSLWTYGPQPPDPSWRWSGEFVVIGRLNCNQSGPPLVYATAEVAPA